MSQPRRVVVTGAAGGLGAATVERLSSQGWHVFAADLDSPALQELANPNVTVVPCDVTSSTSIAALVDRVGPEGLDGLVNFAGILEVGSLVEVSEEAFRRIIDVNLIGTFLVTKALFPLVLKAKGRIVVMSSETGWQPAMPFNGPYATSKHAVEAYADSLRRELMFLGVPVIKIRPGAFKTGMVASIMDRFERTAAASEHFGAQLRTARVRIPKEQARAGDPRDLAALIERALTSAKPRSAYGINANPQMSLLARLPSGAVDRVLKLGLKRG